MTGRTGARRISDTSVLTIVLSSLPPLTNFEKASIHLGVCSLLSRVDRAAQLQLHNVPSRVSSLRSHINNKVRIGMGLEREGGRSTGGPRSAHGYKRVSQLQSTVQCPPPSLPPFLRRVQPSLKSSQESKVSARGNLSGPLEGEIAETERE